MKSNRCNYLIINCAMINFSECSKYFKQNCIEEKKLNTFKRSEKHLFLTKQCEITFCSLAVLHKPCQSKDKKIIP